MGNNRTIKADRRTFFAFFFSEPSHPKNVIVRDNASREKTRLSYLDVRSSRFSDPGDNNRKPVVVAEHL